jgi:hypothetical protein
MADPHGQDQSCHKTFFLTRKDRCNELYTVTEIKLSYFDYGTSFWMFIKAVLIASLMYNPGLN